MYKVMLVDDDYPVLDFLSEVIEWGNLGLELQSMHDNGQDAFLESCDHLPDILITDIGMPKMDGLELTRKLKALDEHLQVIILSCHNEFKYAKQALKLNVQDYLLKESLEPQELSSLLMTIKRKLDQIHQEKKLKHDLQSFASQHNQMRSHHSFHHFVHHSGSGDFVAWCLTNRFRIDRNVELYTPILCVINHYNEQLSKFLTDDLLQFAISNVFQEVITNACDPLAHYFYYEKNQSFIILPVNASIKFDNSQHMIQILMRFQEAVDQALNISLTFVVGERSGKNEMVTQIKAILTNKNYLFYVSPQSIEKIKLTETKEFTDLQIFYNQASNELRKIIVMKNVKLVEPFVDKWFRLIEKNKFDHSIVREWLLKLLLELKNNLKELSHFQTHFKLEWIHQEVLSIGSIHELKVWFVKCLTQIIDLMMESFGQSTHKEVLEACVYISMHVDRKISLDEIAQKLFLNPSYFSRLFKKEVGITFVEYIKKLKMERAKELLNETQLTIGEISERVGYDGQSYFIKLFKQHEGVTPIEYRRVNAAKPC